MRERLFRDRAAWRRWLEKNHATATELWLVYYKKHTGKRSITYQEALDEALCFGWIDSTVNRVDDERFKQRWTPRKPGSIWSERNRRRVAELSDAGRMAAPGLACVARARADGSWGQLREVEARLTPDDLQAALARAPQARRFFEQLAPSHQKQYLYWISSAKRAETRQRRVAETLRRLTAGIKPGIAAPTPRAKKKRARPGTTNRGPMR